MIVGFDDDLAGEAARVANRLHGLLTRIHPSLERFGTPAQMRKAGCRRLVTLLLPKATSPTTPDSPSRAELGLLVPQPNT